MPHFNNAKFYTVHASSEGHPPVPSSIMSMIATNSVFMVPRKAKSSNDPTESFFLLKKLPFAFHIQERKENRV